MRQFARPDIVEIQPNGRITAYKVFPAVLGAIEISGRFECMSNTGQAVLINFPTNTHGYPYQHTGMPMRCQVCDRGLGD